MEPRFYRQIMRETFSLKWMEKSSRYYLRSVQQMYEVSWTTLDYCHVSDSFFFLFFLHRFALLPSREFSPRNVLRNIIFNKSSFFRIPLEYIAKSKILTGALFHRQRLRMHKRCKIEFCQLYSIHSISFINSLYRL